MSSVNCIGAVYGRVRCVPYGLEYMHYTPSSSYIPMISNHSLACIATRNDLRKIFFTARRWFVWSPFASLPDSQRPRDCRVLDPDLWANHHGPSGHAPFLPSRNTTDSHSATFCNFLQVHNTSFRDWSYFVRSRMLVPPGLFVAIGRDFIIVIGKRCVSLTCLAMSDTAAIDELPGFSCGHTLAWK